MKRVLADERCAPGVASEARTLQVIPAILRMKSFLEDEHAGQDEHRNVLRLCEHCDLLGVSAVISADRESNEVIECAICKVRFYFLTEGNRILVTRVEPFKCQA